MAIPTVTSDMDSSTERDSSTVAPFQVAQAEVDGRSTTVLLVHGDSFRLADLVDAAGGLATGGPVPDQVADLLRDWTHWRPRLTAAAAAWVSAPVVSVSRWLLPVEPPKLICIGANYHGHLKEMGTPPPAQPYSFFKPVKYGLTASGQPVTLPQSAKMIDWEAELAIVMGSRVHQVTGPAIWEAVAGYTIVNDLSARDWIASSSPIGVDWVLQKAHDGFSPLGPLLTPREFVDPDQLSIRCWVNDVLKQDSSTADMVFGVQEILEHLASIMTLEPGDVIATGTPAGVGYGRRPQEFLADGDVVIVEIESLGRLETRLVNHS